MMSSGFLKLIFLSDDCQAGNYSFTGTMRKFSSPHPLQKNKNHLHEGGVSVPLSKSQEV